MIIKPPNMICIKKPPNVRRSISREPIAPIINMKPITFITVIIFIPSRYATVFNNHKQNASPVPTAINIPSISRISPKSSLKLKSIFYPRMINRCELL